MQCILDHLEKPWAGRIVSYADCYAIIKLPQKTKDGKSVIYMTNHATSDLQHSRIVLFIADLFTVSIYLMPNIFEAISMAKHE